LPLYESERGIAETRVFVNLVYRLGERWMLSGGMAVGRLEGDAVDSPIVLSRDFYTAQAALMYRF
jgi:outer membrane scaffolding protein for murein synthesis (MipA/OmpV family)